jgi:hypothetical protein
MITSFKSLRLGLALALALLMAGILSVVPAAARPIDQERADVKVMIVQAAPTNADVLTYTIKAVNRGDSAASYARITVPFDAATLKLQDVQFSGTPAWLTKIEGSSFLVQTEQLHSNGGITTATVRFSVLKPSAQLTERLTYSWRDALGGGNGRSNLPLSAAATNQHFFSANLFVPGEPVVFWYHLPNGSVVPTEVRNGVIIDAASTDAKDQGSNYALADAEGAINLRFSTRHLAAGEYMMVARGDISGFTAVGHCTLH